MELRINNGATVSRVYGDSSAELLAGFQYQGDAVDFARAKLAEDAAREFTDSHYIVSNHYDGTLTIVRHEKKAA